MTRPFEYCLWERSQGYSPTSSKVPDLPRKQKHRLSLWTVSDQGAQFSQNGRKSQENANHNRPHNKWRSRRRRIIDTVKWEDILVCKKSYTGIFGWISIRYPKIDSLSQRLIKVGRDAHGDNDWNHVIGLHKETSSVANIEIPSHEG